MPEIVDADAHVIEGATFARQAFEHFRDKIEFRAGADGGLFIEGRPYPDTRGAGAGCPPQHALVGHDPNPHTVEGMLADADRDGIDRMVLFPSMALAAPSFEDPGFARDFCALYNDFIADWCRQSGRRLFGVAVVPIEDVEASVKLAHSAKAAGLVAAMLPPALRQRNLDHLDLDPFYAACQELDLPVAIHGAPGVHLPKIGVDRFTNYVQVHCISFPFDQMTAMTAMVSGGVFDRHPRLRVGFMEAGVTWVPYFLDRLHEHWEKRGDWIEGGWQRDPRDYLARGQIYVSCEPDETVLPAVIDACGDEFILYASDYPHWDAEWPESTRALRSRTDISEKSRGRIMAANAKRFFRLDG